jgi:predicted Zn-dependent protease
VLAHEIAHVAARHIAERLATSYGVQTLAAAALGENPGLVAGLASSVLQQGLLLKYSRTQELEADRLGLRYLVRAGYDPHAAIAMFRKLGAQGGAEPPQFFSSHPSTGDRIEQLKEIIASRNDLA